MMGSDFVYSIITGISSSSMPSIVLMMLYPFICNVLLSLFILFILFLLYIFYERQRTYQQLKHAFVEPPYGLPIVYWYPKLLWNSHHYHKNNPITSTKSNTTCITTENEDDKSFSSSSSSSSSVSSFYQQYISSSNITNVLPRMFRLNRMDTKNENHHSTNDNMNRNCISQYHMYGTVYGIHTSVIHVAHPIPIQQILVSSSSSSSSSSLVSSSSSSTTNTTNTYKSPAYNHFHSFCGQGVFTTDGKDWSMKRHAVLQALLVVVTESTSSTTTTATTTPFKKKRSFIDCLEWECNTTATRLIQTIQDRRNTTTTSSSSSFNIVPLLQRATIGLIYRYITHDSDTNLFHHHHPKDEDHHDTTSTTQRTNANEHFLQQYLHAITNIRMNILAQSRSIWYMILPSWWWNRLISGGGGGGGWFGMKNTLYYMEQTHLLPYIQQMAYMACTNAQIHSPLYKLLQNPIYSTTNINNTNMNDKKSKHSDGDDEHKDPFTFSKNIIDETITLLFAGQDTTAATLSWTLHLLTLYPQVQEQLYQEIYTTLTTQRLDDKENNNNNNVDNENTIDTIDQDTISIRKRDVTKMTYLDAVIKESMRLYPVAPFIVRNIGGTSSNVNTTKKQHTKNSNNTTSIKNHHTTDHPMVFPKPLPKNTLACIWIYSLHRHPNYWSKPDEFIPERWLVNNHIPSTATPTSDDDTTTTTTRQDLGISTPCAYIPYAIGARNCLGQPMANIILRILLCRLIYKYEFLDDRVVQLQQQQKNSNATLTYEQIKPLHKEMQAGFTILPLGGLDLSVKLRH